MTLDEKQGEVADLVTQAAEILEALRNAESCETEHDFHANMIEARMSAAKLLSEIAELVP